MDWQNATQDQILIDIDATLKNIWDSSGKIPTYIDIPLPLYRQNVRELHQEGRIDTYEAIKLLWNSGARGEELRLEMAQSRRQSKS